MDLYMVLSLICDYSLRVYELGPFPNHAAFRLLSKGSDDGPVRTIHGLFGNRLGIATEEAGGVAVWDFITKRCAWWRIQLKSGELSFGRVSTFWFVILSILS